MYVPRLDIDLHHCRTAQQSRRTRRLINHGAPERSAELPLCRCIIIGSCTVRRKSPLLDVDVVEELGRRIVMYAMSSRTDGQGG